MTLAKSPRLPPGFFRRYELLAKTSSRSEEPKTNSIAVGSDHVGRIVAHYPIRRPDATGIVLFVFRRQGTTQGLLAKGLLPRDGLQIKTSKMLLADLACLPHSSCSLAIVAAQAHYASIWHRGGNGKRRRRLRTMCNNTFILSQWHVSLLPNFARLLLPLLWASPQSGRCVH